MKFLIVLLFILSIYIPLEVHSQIDPALREMTAEEHKALQDFIEKMNNEREVQQKISILAPVVIISIVSIGIVIFFVLKRRKK